MAVQPRGMVRGSALGPAVWPPSQHMPSSSRGVTWWVLMRSGSGHRDHRSVLGPRGPHRTTADTGSPSVAFMGTSNAGGAAAPHQPAPQPPPALGALLLKPPRGSGLWVPSSVTPTSSCLSTHLQTMCRRGPVISPGAGGTPRAPDPSSAPDPTSTPDPHSSQIPRPGRRLALISFFLFSC